MERKTLIVDIFGGPGIGKSTLAAGTYANLSMRGHNVELIREYVKPWAYRAHEITQWDEAYLFAKQLRAESALYGKIDIVLTDRPLRMSAVYEKLYSPQRNKMFDLVNSVHQEQEEAGIHHLSLLVTRKTKYSVLGRFEDEASAIKVDQICDELYSPQKVNTLEDVLDAIKKSQVK
jgi:thymidylate kinase